MKFKIENRVIKGDDELIVGDNCDYVAEFEFDDEWKDVTKTARFTNCGKYKDVLLVNDKCCFPVEVLKCGYVEVGVYSSDMTTTRHKVFVQKSIKDETGCEAESTPDVYEQLTRRLDEIKQTMPQIVCDYLEDNKDTFRGEQGPKGDTGEQGPQGDVGNTSYLNAEVNEFGELVIYGGERDDITFAINETGELEVIYE